MVSSRKEALALGHTYYYTGLPCKRGHFAPRYTSSPLCVECSRLQYLRRRPKTLKELRERYHANPEYHRKKSRESATRNPKVYWARSSIKNARIRAKKIDVAFDIDVRYLLSIIPDHCPVFGTPFVFAGNKKICAESASLDRLVPAKGYIRGNVVVISNLANAIKTNASANEVAKVAQWMYEQGL